MIEDDAEKANLFAIQLFLALPYQRKKSTNLILAASVPFPEGNAPFFSKVQGPHCGQSVSFCKYINGILRAIH